VTAILLFKISVSTCMVAVEQFYCPSVPEKIKTPEAVTYIDLILLSIVFTYIIFVRPVLLLTSAIHEL